MPIPEALDLKSWFGRSPLTDPRALGSSFLFHAILVVLASAAVLTAALPQEPEGPQVIRGEIDPVDNRANKAQGEGGGNPGDLGADQLASALAPIAAQASDSGASESVKRNAPADALLSEILPSPSQTSDAVQQALPGPQTSSLGLVASAGGGGGGSGGGAGGGVGRGVGPGTEFFGAREHAVSFSYVIDCSGSMAACNSLDVAKRELMSSLNRLAPDAQFSVVFYNLSAKVITDAQGHRGAMPATAANKNRVSNQLAQIAPDGGTEHMIALRTALGFRPEVIFFLTDADLMTQSDVNAILAEAGTTRIQAVEFGRGVEINNASNPLRRLATSTGGTYRYIDVMLFPKAR